MATRRPALRATLCAGLSALAIVALGCAESHGVEDAAPGLDAAPLRSDGGPDARAPRDAPPPCPDADGDGDRDVRCGGADCDDADPRVSSILSRCTSPGARDTCVGSVRAEAPCADPLPFCDARSGACVPAEGACGDRVVHPGEECDDGNGAPGDGCAACILEPCTASSQCPPDRPWCSDLRDDGTFRCQPGNPGGAPRGAACDADIECETGWCEESQGRCSAACEVYDDCGTRLSYCRASHHRCFFACRGDAECGGGNRCMPVAFGEVALYRCARDSGAWVPDGDYRCRDHFECHSLACAFSAGGCSILCATDADCPDPNRPYCLDVAPPGFYGDVPAWWAPEFGSRVTVCADGPPVRELSCYDEDSDGLVGLWCGGPDCADGFPRVIASRGCASATSQDACTATSAVSEPVACPPETPLCRYPQGDCVAMGEACGDRVVHPGEECDDGNDVAGDGCSACTIE